MYKDRALNVKQMEAVARITTSRNVLLPPVLLLGPFGTGKTFTLAQAVLRLMKEEPDARVLLCTHSNRSSCGCAVLYRSFYFLRLKLRRMALFVRLSLSCFDLFIRSTRFPFLVYSAADLYVRDYFDRSIRPLAEAAWKKPQELLLRIYYRNRRVNTVERCVLNYCLLNPSASDFCAFRDPTLEDLQSARIVVTTLMASRCLSNMGLPEG